MQGRLDTLSALLMTDILPSDARSGHVIDERIRPTLEAGSRVGSKKPVCVIIDEIDGATGAGDNVALFRLTEGLCC